MATRPAFDDCNYREDCQCAQRGYVYETDRCTVPRVRQATADLDVPDDALFLDLPAEAEQRISRLYAWIVTHRDGSEGIASVGSMPLITSKRHLADLMGRAAEQVLALSADAAEPGVRVELRAFDWR